jgi:tetratricopeptide (TPR) repeat protein
LARRRRPTQEGSAAKTLDELESASDRLVLWLGERQREILAGAVGLLLVAGGWGYMASSSQEANDLADTALSEVQNSYRLAMGASPGGVLVPELANPAAAREIREEFTARYAEVGEAYAGTGAGGVAFLEAGKLEQALGNADAAVAAYRAGLESLAEGDALRGFLWSRMGSVYEETGRWSEAADAYAEAGALTGYAIHAGATAAAIRAHIHAGEPTAALAAAEELARSEPDFVLPQFLRAQLDELRVASVPN